MTARATAMGRATLVAAAVGSTARWATTTALCCLPAPASALPEAPAALAGAFPGLMLEVIYLHASSQAWAPWPQVAAVLAFSGGPVVRLTTEQEARWIPGWAVHLILGQVVRQIREREVHLTQEREVHLTQEQEARGSQGAAARCPEPVERLTAVPACLWAVLEPIRSIHASVWGTVECYPKTAVRRSSRALVAPLAQRAEPVQELTEQVCRLELVAPTRRARQRALARSNRTSVLLLVSISTI